MRKLSRALLTKSQEIRTHHSSFGPDASPKMQLMAHVLYLFSFQLAVEFQVLFQTPVMFTKLRGTRPRQEKCLMAISLPVTALTSYTFLWADLYTRKTATHSRYTDEDAWNATLLGSRHDEKVTDSSSLLACGSPFDFHECRGEFSGLMARSNGLPALATRGQASVTRQLRNLQRRTCKRSSASRRSAVNGDPSCMLHLLMCHELCH
ncbi:hypothetical protein TGVAND_220145 [Toxoplasma gondii VAND]|uniref:Uncharacterized protein n=2 Tax=Toxoplasma gondii TaxID=5811 RepID=A0A2G8XY44_TOXGO|nr:hypothetical protein TGVAND_220145 [Toxoplasma gondii VAND]PIL99942.1 hypothetical protein TGCOUG_220145 [Toxoplasma gondii COUG]